MCEDPECEVRWLHKTCLSDLERNAMEINGKQHHFQSPLMWLTRLVHWICNSYFIERQTGKRLNLWDDPELPRIIANRPRTPPPSQAVFDEMDAKLRELNLGYFDEDEEKGLPSTFHLADSVDQVSGRKILPPLQGNGDQVPASFHADHDQIRRAALQEDAQHWTNARARCSLQRGKVIFDYWTPL